MTKLTGSSATAAAKAKSLAMVRERAQEIRDADREASERRCRCAEPIPGRVYLGWTQCALCQRLMERGHPPSEGP